METTFTARDAQTPMILGSLLLVLYHVFRILQIGKRDPRLPPGPPTIPILGNIHQIPIERSYLQYGLFHHQSDIRFTKWARQYGGVMSLKVGRGTIIVLTDGKAVKQILDKQSAVSSNRPPFYVGHDVITHGNHLGVMPYGNDWRVLEASRRR